MVFLGHPLRIGLGVCERARPTSLSVVLISIVVGVSRSSLDSPASIGHRILLFGKGFLLILHCQRYHRPGCMIADRARIDSMRRAQHRLNRKRKRRRRSHAQPWSSHYAISAFSIDKRHRW